MRTLATTARRCWALALVVALAAASAAPGVAAAAPLAPAPRASFDSGADYVERGGLLDVGVSVTLARPSTTLRVRLRLYSESGTLLFQRTETRNALLAQTYLVRVSRSMEPFGLHEGRHRLEARVEAEGAAPATVSQPILVVESSHQPVPLAVVIRLSGAPVFEPGGALARDPAADTRMRAQATAIAQLASVRPDLRFTVAIPPMLLDEWGRLGEGYTLPDGTPVARDAAEPTAYRAAVSGLATAAAVGTGVLALPYADPDLGALARIGALDDLAEQLDAGAQVLTGALGATAASGTVVSAGTLPASAAAALKNAGVAFAVVAASAVASSRVTTIAPGVYAAKQGGPTLIVTDEAAAAALSDVATPRSDLLARLFERLIDKRRAGQPVVAIVDAGPGSRTTVEDLQAVLARIARVRWIRLVTASEASAMRPAGALTLPEPRVATPAEQQYWAAVAQARTRVLALASAAGADDADVAAGRRNLMIAECGSWLSGPTDAWTAERGTSFTAAADQSAWAALSALKLTSPNVTLSATTGKVRVSVANASGKALRLVLEAKPAGMRLPQGTRLEIDAPPGETILTVPVDMGASLSGTLGLRLLAGSLQVATASSSVRASYMDRLVLFGGVVLLLLIMLGYIWRRRHRALERLRQVARRGDKRDV
ncbi:MAG TPA: hypothetical protein VF902_04850 [Coriobacteriia bacterium]